MPFSQLMFNHQASNSGFPNTKGFQKNHKNLNVLSTLGVKTWGVLLHSKWWTLEAMELAYKVGVMCQANSFIEGKEPFNNQRELTKLSLFFFFILKF
jgi:hypothetical protein